MTKPRHWNHDDILKAPGEDLGGDSRRVTLTLQPDDTAYSAVSTKYVWQGPGKVTYTIHTSGWDVTINGVTRRYPS